MFTLSGRGENPAALFLLAVTVSGQEMERNSSHSESNVWGREIGWGLHGNLKSVNVLRRQKDITLTRDNRESGS